MTHREKAAERIQRRFDAHNARFAEILAKIPEPTDTEADELAELLSRIADRARPGPSRPFDL